MLCYVDDDDDESYLHLLLYIEWGLISVAEAGRRDACIHKSGKKRHLWFDCCNEQAVVWLKHAATNTSISEHTWQPLCTDFQSISAQSKLTDVGF